MIHNDVAIPFDHHDEFLPSSSSTPQRVQQAVLPVTFSDLPDKTAEATATIELIELNIYQSKSLGKTEYSLDCDCTPLIGI